MRCPHLTDESASFECTSCGGSFCLDCFAGHFCEMPPSLFDDTDQDEAIIPVASELYAELENRKSPQQFGEDLVLASLGEAGDLEEDSGPFEVAETTVEIVTSTPSVALNGGVNTLQQPLIETRTEPVRLRCALWNIANLGGKFGYPTERDQAVIEAIAEILSHAGADVIVILEVLEKTAPDRRPKEPIKPKEMRTRVDLWPEGQKLPTVRFFNTVVEGLIWQQSPDFAPPGEFAGGAFEAHRNVLARQWKSLNEIATGFRDQIEHLVAEGYTHWTQEYKANYSKKILQAIKEENGKEAAAEAAQKDKLSEISIKKLREAVLEAFCEFILDLIVAELKEELVADYECTDCVEGYSRSFKTRNKDGVYRCGRCKKEDTNRSRTNWRWNAHEDLVASDYENQLQIYRKRLAAWEGQQEKLKNLKRGQHHGLAELMRIRDALNKLAGDSYESWPAELPDDKDTSMYSQHETYGVLWRKGKLSCDPKKVAFASVRRPGVKFDKREPLCIPLKLSGGPEILFVPYHAPSPSDKNATARKKDFPVLIELCKAERKAKGLAILLSDLNVNTLSGSKDVEHCKGALKVKDLFAGIAGTTTLPRSFRFRDRNTTLAKTKVTPPLIRCLLSDQLVKEWEKDELMISIRALGKHSFTDKSIYRRGEDIVGLIESFLVETRYDYGASAYDKITAISASDASGTYSLRPLDGAVVPFPQALAYAEEEALFLPPSPMESQLPDFGYLLDRKKRKDVLAALREDNRPELALDARSNHQERLLQLLADARKLSDHMLLLADFSVEGTQALSTSGSRQDEEMKDTDNEEKGPEDEDSIAELCNQYEQESDETKRSAIMARILEDWGSYSDGLKDRSSLASRITRALDKHPIASGERKKEADSDELRKTRPALAESEDRKKKTGSLNEKLRSENKRIRQNSGGGNCLFYSLSQLFAGDESLAPFIRARAVAHLRKILSAEDMDEKGGFHEADRNGLRTILDQLHTWHKLGWPNETLYKPPPFGIDKWTWYLHVMAHEGAWGDLIVLCAVSHLYGVRVEIVVEAGAGWWMDYVDFSSAPSKSTWQLRNQGNFHFEGIVSQEDGEEIAETILQNTDTGGSGKRGETESKKSPEKTAPSKSGRPQPTGPVFLWPTDDPADYWTRQDAKDHPDCLFLFGENDQHKNSGYLQSGTQANIRGEKNAYGIRTCWLPGAPEKGGRMVDSELARNQKAIDEDIAEAKKALQSGKYKTLIVPWSPKANQHALGAGVAQLWKAPKTSKHLTDQIDALIKFAGKTVSTVKVERRTTGVQRKEATERSDSLYLFEDCDLLRAKKVDEETQVSLRSLDNAIGVRTHWLPVPTSSEDGLMTDADLAKNRKAIDDDLEKVKEALQSGKYKRLVLPWQGGEEGSCSLVLGNGKLQQQAPETCNHLHKSLLALEEWAQSLNTEGVREHRGESRVDESFGIDRPLKRKRSSEEPPVEGEELQRKWSKEEGGTEHSGEIEEDEENEPMRIN